MLRAGGAEGESEARRRRGKCIPTTAVSNTPTTQKKAGRARGRKEDCPPPTVPALRRGAPRSSALYAPILGQFTRHGGACKIYRHHL
jgi:hypothetical protein